MIGRRSPLLVIVVLCGALVAGCGSASSPTTGSSTTTPIATTKSAPSTPAPAVTTSTTSTATPTGGSGAASAASVAEYAAICRLIVEHEPTLAASVKSKVEGICAKAAKGDLAGARAASKEVCAEVISASPLPATAKQKALASCKES
jgi:hypothetical protein